MSTENTRASSAYVVKFPIGVKLALIIGFIVLISLGSVTFLNSHFVGEDVKITAENNNLSTKRKNNGYDQRTCKKHTCYTGC